MLKELTVKISLTVFTHKKAIVRATSSFHKECYKLLSFKCWEVLNGENLTPEKSLSAPEITSLLPTLDDVH